MIPCPPEIARRNLAPSGYRSIPTMACLMSFLMATLACGISSAAVPPDTSSPESARMECLLRGLVDTRSDLLREEEARRSKSRWVTGNFLAKAAGQATDLAMEEIPWGTVAIEGGKVMMDALKIPLRPLDSHPDPRVDLAWENFSSLLASGEPARYDELKTRLNKEIADAPDLKRLKGYLSDPNRRLMLPWIFRPFLADAARSLRKTPEQLLAEWRSNENRAVLIDALTESISRSNLTAFRRPSGGETGSRDGRAFHQEFADAFRAKFADFLDTIRNRYPGALDLRRSQAEEGLKLRVREFSVEWNSLSPSERRVALTEILPLIAP